MESNEDVRLGWTGHQMIKRQYQTLRN
jgi:hypothetical protein